MAKEETPKCVALFDRDGGVETSKQLVQGLSALMGDLSAGRITNGRANSICNAAGKILITVKLEQQYGQKGMGGPTLQLIQHDEPTAEVPPASEIGG